MATITISIILTALLLAHLVIWGFHKHLYPESMNLSPVACFRLYGWALVAIAVSFVARWLLRQQDFPSGLRAVPALAPLVPAALFARTVHRWLRLLDELQQRIQLEALFHALATTALVFIVIDLLQAAGCIEFIHWGWEGIFTLVYVLWMFGGIIANRRYQ